MDLEELKQRLKKYRKEDIIITKHAEIRALARNVNIEKVKENIIKPDKLVYFKKEKSESPTEEKFECYFAYSQYYCHKYILTLNRKIIIVTIISINRDWQKSITK
jgi:hypothetical protein